MNRVRLDFPLLYVRRAHNTLWTLLHPVHGQNLNATREVASCESVEVSDILPGMAGCEPEVVVSQTSIRRKTVSEGTEASDVTSRRERQRPDTFVDEGNPTRPLSGSWSRAGMLSDEYDTVNKSEEPYGRKEGAKDDLRYGCMEKYKRDSARR
ncbi:hypothetical protein APHAL10511_005289 [Amanita phalloides]|nr:hypothetical protein APHAL10511_005289 [Amanita phalloides]